jgi:hypothetical protein
MAEGVGFEPTRRLPAYTLSRRADSARLSHPSECFPIITRDGAGPRGFGRGAPDDRASRVRRYLPGLVFGLGLKSAGISLRIPSRTSVGTIPMLRQDIPLAAGRRITSWSGISA